MTTKSGRNLSEVRRVVIKVGSQVVTGGGRLPTDPVLFQWLTEDIKWLINRGVEVILVSSGAVAAGMGRLEETERPASIPEKQAIAAVGQLALMRAYEDAFAVLRLKIGQVLLTRDDLDNRYVMKINVQRAARRSRDDGHCVFSGAISRLAVDPFAVHKSEANIKTTALETFRVGHVSHQVIGPLVSQIEIRLGITVVGFKYIRWLNTERTIIGRKRQAHPTIRRAPASIPWIGVGGR